MDVTFAGYRLLDPVDDRRTATAYAVPVVRPGGLAVVDAAHPASGQRVRLVLLPPIDSDLVRRTVVRARTVDHPHVLPDVEVVEDGGRVAVVVPWTDGGTLAQLLEVRGTIDPAEVLTIVRPLAGALIAIGDAGLCHGALLPELVFFDADGRPRMAGSGAGLAVAVATGEDRILPVGAAHLAPEVARGAVPDIRADLFALGSVALLAVSGRPAWPAEDVTEVLVQSTAGLWPEADPQSATPELAAIIDGLLTADPALRPPAAVVQAELRSAGRPRPVDLTALRSTQGDQDASSEPDPLAADEVESESAAPETGWGPEDHGEGSTVGVGVRSGGERAHRASRSDGRRRRTSVHPGRRRQGLAVAVLVAAVVGGVVVGGGLWPAADGVPAGGSADAGADGAAGAGATRSGRASSISHQPISTETAWAGPADPTEASAGAAGNAAAVSPAVSATVDWLSVVRDLDRRRADALAAADPDLLDAVYVAGPALDSDRALVVDLRARGLRVDGGAHVITSAVPLPAGTMGTASTNSTGGASVDGPGGADGGEVELRVERSLPAYPVIDGSGRTVGSTASAGVEAALLTVRPVADGYAIVAVGPA